MRNEEEKLLKLVQNLIQIDSSDPGAYEGEIGIFITNWLRSHVPNAIIETQEVLPGRHNIRAVLPGKISHPALVFICHMDTVTLGDGWKKSTPLSGELLEGKIYGRGACDMKSGLACALSAFARAGALAAQGQHPNHSLVLIASVDEEDFMRGAEKAIVSEWVTENDWVLDAEPTNGEIRMAHKGRTWFQVSVEGVTAHASTPYKGADAIAGIAEIITRIRNEILAAPVHEELGNSTVTFGMINGGYRPYVVPDKAKVWIDMRLVPPLTPECAKDIVARAISQAEKLVPGIRGFTPLPETALMSRKIPILCFFLPLAVPFATLPARKLSLVCFPVIQTPLSLPEHCITPTVCPMDQEIWNWLINQMNLWISQIFYAAKKCSPI